MHTLEDVRRAVGRRRFTVRELADVLALGAVVAEPGGERPWDTVTTVVVGPEGGFSPAEIAGAAGQVDLGPGILRAETASMVAAARMVAHWRR